MPSVLVRKAHAGVRDGIREAVPEERRCASAAEVNRELTMLKRTFNLAIQAGKLLAKPHVPMLREAKPERLLRAGPLPSLVRHLPAPLRPVVEFAHITGWRIASEILPLEWRQVDLTAGEVRLDAGTTKNGDGRVFPSRRPTGAPRRQQPQHVAHGGRGKSSRGCSCGWSQMGAADRSWRGASSASTRHGRPRAPRRVVRVVIRTTFAARPSATWFEPASRSASRWT